MCVCTLQLSDSHETALFSGLFLRQFFNTAVLVLLVNINVRSAFSALGLPEPPDDFELGSLDVWAFGLPW